MIQVCIMGANEGRLQPNKRFYLTLWGATSLTRPTVARQILARRQREKQGIMSEPSQFFLTIMGAAEITVPTLAEEYVDLRDLIGSGSLTMEDWDEVAADLGQSSMGIASFTIMGAFAETELPSEDAEIESLALQTHLGSIPESARQVLQYGIGQDGGERRATLRRAMQTV